MKEENKEVMLRREYWRGRGQAERKSMKNLGGSGKTWKGDNDDSEGGQASPEKEEEETCHLTKDYLFWI